MILIAWSLLASLIYADPCHLPNLSVSRQKVCSQIFKFDRLARNVAVPRGVPQIYSKNRALPLAGDVFDCQDISCICSFIKNAVFSDGVCKMPDGGIYSKSLRKELRMLSDQERVLYTQAFWAIRPDVYAMLSAVHANSSTAIGAHSGPNFCPWHRELLKRLEIGMRTKEINGAYPFVSVSLPYWDSSIDDTLYTLFRISPTFSTMFCEEIMGTQKNGTLLDGLFANFSGTFGLTRRSLDRWPGLLHLFQREDIEAVMRTAKVNDVMAATAGDSKCPTVPIDNIELIHGDVHVWMGGDMEELSTSSNDPIFFLHHNFIDFIFENWRQNTLTRAQRESVWNTGSPDCYSQAHRADAIMIPFGPKTNLDGMSNTYTDNLYSFQPRPMCNRMTLCASKYLWCNIATGYCIARLRPEAPCYTYYGIDPCYKSVCQNYKCRPL